MPVKRLTCEYRCRQKIGAPFREALRLIEDTRSEVYARLPHITETLQEQKSAELVVGEHNNRRLGRFSQSLASFTLRTVQVGMERCHTINARIEPFVV